MNRSTAQPGHGTFRRGFTLLEVMLASVLGVLIILAAMGIFKSLQISDRRQQIRMEDDAQFASAHRIVGRIFHRLLMAQDTSQKEGEIDEKIKEDDDRNSEARSHLVDDDAMGSRLALQPDMNTPGTMLIGPADQARSAPIQTLQLTLTETPIPGLDNKSPEEKLREQLLKERILIQAQSRLSRNRSKSSDRDTGSLGQSLSGDAQAAIDQALGAAGSGSRSRRGSSHMDTDRSEPSTRRSGRNSDRSDRTDGSARSADDGDDRTASERADDFEQSQVRAKGVRAVLELRPDTAADPTVQAGQPPAIRSTDIGVSDTGQVTYSLWYRELPPVAFDEDGDLSLLTDGERGTGAGRRDSSDRSAEGGRSERSDRPESLSERRSGRSSRRDRNRDSESGSSTGDRADRRSASERLDDRATGGPSVDIRDLASANLAPAKEVRLLSGLVGVHWTAFRGRKERDKITAYTDRELPAFIELELITATGRREKWMFDVAWVVGPEPGSVLPDRNDPLNSFRSRDGGTRGGDGGDGGSGDGGGKGGGGSGGKGGSGKGGSGKGGGGSIK